METFDIERKQDCLIVTFRGEITLEVTNQLKSEMDLSIKQEDFSNLVVDLSDISFMDSSGIGFLVALNTKIMGLNKKMYLYKPSQQVRKTLALVQLANFFQTLEDEDELLAL